MIRFLLPVLLAMASANAAASADPTEIRALEQAQADAWNAHDAAAYASLFAPDADVINVLGWHWKSRDELEAKLSVAFSHVFAGSTLRIENTAVKMLRRDLALVHVDWSMTGALSPSGKVSDTPERGIQTQLVERRSGRWLIRAFQNTNSIPERPFPGKPNP